MKNPVGVTGLIGAVSVLVVALLSVFDVDVELDQVAVVLGALWAIVSTIIFRQNPDAGGGGVSE